MKIEILKFQDFLRLKKKNRFLYEFDTFTDSKKYQS